MTGIQYTDLPIDKVRQVTAAHIDTSSAQTDDNEDDEASTSDQADPMAHLQQPMDGLHLYVCCHGSRDSRCGKIGNRLAHRLDKLIQQRQLQEQVQVFKCSHVGGHKVLQPLLRYLLAITAALVQMFYPYITLSLLPITFASQMQ